MIIWFLLQGLLTVGVFIIYITNGPYGGGEVGMTPSGVMLATLIQFLFSVGFFYLLRKYFKDNKRIIFFIFNMLFYELAFLTFYHSIPIFNTLERGLTGFLNKGYSLSSVVSGACVIVAFYIFQLIKHKDIPG